MPKASTLATSSPATVTALRDVLGVQDVLGTVNIYDDTAAGIAATVDGEYFSVPSAEDDEYLILYKNVATVATEQKRYPAKAAIDAKVATADLAATDGSELVGYGDGTVKDALDSFNGTSTQTGAVEGTAFSLPSKPAGYKRIVIDGVTYAIPYYNYGTLRAVATRGVMPNTRHATNTQTMAQSRHFARDAVSAIRLVASNWYVQVSGGVASETGSGGTMTVTASVSTDLSSWTPVTWGGNSSASIADGDNAVSDDVAISLTDGQEFYVRMWKSVAGSGRAIYCNVYSDSTNNELFRIGTSVTDSTDGSAFTGTANEYFAGPTAILGITAKPAILIIGDSISYGLNDTYSPSDSGDLGKFAPSIGSDFAYIMAARSSDLAQQFLASSAKRVALATYATHVIGGHGRNDLDLGRTAAEIEADIESIAGLFSIPVWWDTIPPRTSSTDSFATVENQTVSSTNTHRATVNDWLRAGPAALAGAFDSCQAIENDPDNNDGKWKAGSITSDGQHPNGDGYALIASSGEIDPDLLD